ncbi:DUF5330 domain-containing protein [Nitratireductor luteus]|uniref:DUF5330 domain-containing protein n=1 Tax=Nitratireductor luteus TaxID=2976980 RepID=UPI00223F0573|nr:DUF5330 domain-containing protein [Nitratireductor luteus]
MGFLIRSAFWLSLVLLVIPLDTGSGGEGPDAIGPIQAFFAAREAVVDMVGICERKPEVCETGRAALATIAARARQAVTIASGLVDADETSKAAVETAGDSPRPSEPVLTTGSIEASE